MKAEELLQELEEFRKLNPPKITYYYNIPSNCWIKVCSMCGVITSCKHERSNGGTEMTIQKLHFKVHGEGFTRLVRDIALWENDKPRAIRMLKSLNEIKKKHIDAVLNGDAKFISIEDGKRLQLVYEVDKDFKKQIQEHYNLNFVKIRDFDVPKKIIHEYINHFDKDKENLGEWEDMRGKLHNDIFKFVNIDRHSTEGIKFSKELDKYCIPIIEKFDYFTAGLKKISSASNESELAIANIEVMNRQYYEMFRKRSQ